MGVLTVLRVGSAHMTKTLMLKTLGFRPHLVRARRERVLAKAKARARLTTPTVLTVLRIGSVRVTKTLMLKTLGFRPHLVRALRERVLAKAKASARVAESARLRRATRGATLIFWTSQRAAKRGLFMRSRRRARS